MTPRDKAKRLAELQAELASIQKAIDALKDLPTYTYCNSCVYSDNHFYCRQFGDVVPVEFRHQTDCPKFDDDIPF